jgi:hypothetical protein
VDTPAANGLATAEVSPSLHDPSASIKAISTPISSLHRSPDLMAQRFFEEVARKTGSSDANTYKACATPSPGCQVENFAATVELRLRGIADIALAPSEAGIGSSIEDNATVATQVPIVTVVGMIFSYRKIR